MLKDTRARTGGALHGVVGRVRTKVVPEEGKKHSCLYIRNDALLPRVRTLHTLHGSCRSTAALISNCSLPRKNAHVRKDARGADGILGARLDDRDRIGTLLLTKRNTQCKFITRISRFSVKRSCFSVKL